MRSSHKKNKNGDTEKKRDSNTEKRNDNTRKLLST